VTEVAETFDAIVIGGGPAGQKAAIQGAKAKKRVLLVDEAGGAGGECVRRGTIPSKTLRETACALTAFRARTGGVFDLGVREDLQVESLMSRMSSVVLAHSAYMGKQLARNDVVLWRARARFVDANTIEARGPDGRARRATAPTIVIAVGSRPRTPEDIHVDHENILDSDSFLSMGYIPRTLTVLGGGVIASEYASILASLGCQVTMIDRADRPLAFLSPNLSRAFLGALERAGGRFVGGAITRAVCWNGLDAVETILDSGEILRADKMLVARGRVANLRGLGLDAAGLVIDGRGLLPVDEACRTSVPGIYAVGDAIGPPALASAAMEQGRRAMRHALGLPPAPPAELVPMAIYTIPEISTVGLSEAEAVKRHGAAIVGRARFDEVARGHIAAAEDGILELVALPGSGKLVGVEIAGEGAAELVHVGQMALLAGMTLDAFVDNLFNFPTLAEAYRVAALDASSRI
jgi:NAD(P) transhydrogenase